MTLGSVLIVIIGICVVAILLPLYRDVRRLRIELIDLKNKSQGGRSSSQGDLALSERTVHDLNNVIATISGFASAAAEELPKSSPIRSDLIEISEASSRAAQLVVKLRQTRSSGEGQNSNDAPVKRANSSPPAYPQRTMRTSSYPPVAKPVPPYEKPTGELGGAMNPQCSDLKPPFQDRQEAPKPVTGSFLSRPKSPLPKKEGRQEHLFIVDDELQLLTMFRRIFEPLGYQVTTFSHGLDAWEEFQKKNDTYDLAILDQRMPDMSGTSLAIEMLNLRPDFPIILLTGYSDTISPEDAARIGIRRFLSKPIPQAELTATIRKTLDEPLPSTL